MDEMLTVKQWAEKVGLKLNDYSGFLEMYKRLAQSQDKDWFSKVENRFTNAGDILCTRRAFADGITLCTMIPPKVEQWEAMLEFIPEFIESLISGGIYYLVNFKMSKLTLREKAENLLRLVRLKIKAREKIKELNGPLEDIRVEEIGKIAEKIEKYGETVDAAEFSLLGDIADELELLLQKKRIREFQLPNKKIKLAVELNSAVKEKRKICPSPDEYMYIEIPGQPKKPFIQTYSFLTPGETRTGVALNIPGSLSGTLRTTKAINDKINAHMGAGRIEEDAARHYLEVIDNGVLRRDRRSFMSSLEELVKQIGNGFKGEDR